jgi:hypothetical protein
MDNSESTGKLSTLSNLQQCNTKKHAIAFCVSQLLVTICDDGTCNLAMESVMTDHQKNQA